MRSVLVALSMTVLCGVASAQTTVPNTFTAGTAAKAAEVNANFQALATAINALATRVARLDGPPTAAGLAGTYAVNGIQTELVPGSGSGRVIVYTYEGTATFAANGTGTFSLNSKGHNLLFTSPLTTTRSAVNSSTGATPFTWSLAGNTLTALDGAFSIVSGGQLLIRSTVNPADGTNVLLLLSRTN